MGLILLQFWHRCKQDREGENEEGENGGEKGKKEEKKERGKERERDRERQREREESQEGSTGDIAARERNNFHCQKPKKPKKEM